jgi:hypothetical protein
VFDYEILTLLKNYWHFVRFPGNFMKIIAFVTTHRNIGTVIGDGWSLLPYDSE